MIDAHTHFFPARLTDAIRKAFVGYGWTLVPPKPHAEMIAELAARGTTAAWLLPYSHKAGIASDLNRWVADLASAHPMLVPFGCAHPDDEDLEALARQAFDDLGLQGFKLHCNVGHFRCDDPRLDPLYREATRRKRPLVIHAGRAPYHDTWVGIESIRAMLERHPDLVVVIPHLGADEWVELFALMDRFPGLHTDTSAVLSSRRLNPSFEDPAWWEGLRQHVVAHPDRVLYGSDYPWIEELLEESLAGVKRLRLPADVEAMVLAHNAERLVPVASAGPS